jgi:hypothetical protein
MLLSFDVAPDAVCEHDEWHTHEHMPERLSIPGFLRGTRWVAVRGGPRYLVIYEVEALSTLSSAPYLERLNHPSPWTSRMMPHYRRMRRGLCSVKASFGLGAGGFSLLLRFKPANADASAFRSGLLEEALAPLPQRRGIGSVHLLEEAARAGMTTEQRIRGADEGMDWAVVVMGYERDAVEELASTVLSGDSLKHRGASDVHDGLYAMHYSLSGSEVG